MTRSFTLAVLLLSSFHCTVQAQSPSLSSWCRYLGWGWGPGYHAGSYGSFDSGAAWSEPVHVERERMPVPVIPQQPPARLVPAGWQSDPSEERNTVVAAPVPSRMRPLRRLPELTTFATAAPDQQPTPAIRRLPLLTVSLSTHRETSVMKRVVSRGEQSVRNE